MRLLIIDAGSRETPLSPNPPIRARCWDTSASIVQYAPEDEPNGADSEHLLGHGFSQTFAPTFQDLWH